ncbi:hypothetical protein B0H13DRAFT_1869505 [Mycena leptocephala]|nr:hypothetical protein B0H13DRAFT_1869505 [Mycena leptocephala]
MVCGRLRAGLRGGDEQEQSARGERRRRRCKLANGREVPVRKAKESRLREVTVSTARLRFSGSGRSRWDAEAWRAGEKAREGVSSSVFNLLYSLLHPTTPGPSSLQASLQYHWPFTRQDAPVRSCARCTCKISPSLGALFEITIPTTTASESHTFLRVTHYEWLLYCAGLLTWDQLMERADVKVGESSDFARRVYGYGACKGAYVLIWHAAYSTPCRKLLEALVHEILFMRGAGSRPFGAPVIKPIESFSADGSRAGFLAQPRLSSICCLRWGSRG